MGSDVDVLTNWSRWGDRDERGAANFITPELVVRAARLVDQGRVFSLCMPLRANQVPIASIRFPAMHFMTLDGGDFAAGVTLADGAYQAADDYIFMACHGGTHVDALSHVWYDKRLYNGYGENSVRSYGATKCGIENLTSLVTRGVLLDVARHLGVEHLPAGYAIGAEELESCAQARGIDVGQGDCVLIRTGWLRMFEKDRAAYMASSPGIGLDAGRWLAKREISAVGSDNMAVEVAIAEDTYEGGSRAPIVHKLLIRDCGTYVMELLDLESISAANLSQFLFVLAPLRIVGGVGSPVNPLAII